MSSPGLPAAPQGLAGAGPSGQERPPATAGAPGRRAGVLVGVLVALLVGLAAAAFLVLRPPPYTAAATVVVLPEATFTGDVAASYYDTLSQGQVVATFAELLRARLPAGQGGPQVSVVVVPDTSVVRLVATGTTASAAETAADAALDASPDPLRELGAPYRAAVVSRAEDRGERQDRPLPLYAAVAVLGALGAGLLAVRAWQELARARVAAR